MPISRATTRPIASRNGIIVVMVALAACFAHSARADAGWSCNAYGSGGSKRQTWQTVSGPSASSRDAAWQAALAECARRGFRGCRGSGCWPA